jgi:hypothetical protein
MARFVFREHVIEWAGQKVTFTPTMAFLRKLEASGFPLMTIAHSVNTGAPLASYMSGFMAHVLHFAGYECGEGGVDELDADIYGCLTMAEPTETMAIYNAMIEAITPVEGEVPDKKKAS